MLEEIESGPFCTHWLEPGDCEIECDRCGHMCMFHSFTTDERECCEPDCDCQGFEEGPNE
jgi:hypothetical protein